MKAKRARSKPTRLRSQNKSCFKVSPSADCINSSMKTFTQFLKESDLDMKSPKTIAAADAEAGTGTTNTASATIGREKIVCDN
jgi:hypothetical protein